MRSQLVEEAIKEIKYLKSFGTSGIIPRWEVIDIVLNYIEELENGEVEKTNLEIAKLEHKIVELEKENEKYRNFHLDIQGMRSGKELLIKYINDSIPKEAIRDKIKEYRNKKNTIYPRIKQLENELNSTKIKQLQDEEKGLDLQIANKKYQIEKYSNTIRKIEEEIKSLNDNLNIIY